MKEVESAGAAIFRESPYTRKLQILLVSPFGDKFGLPKGHVEEGESILEAATREVYEESRTKFTPMGLSNEMVVYDLITRDKNPKTKETEKVHKTVYIFVSYFDSADFSSKDETKHDWEVKVSKFFDVDYVIENKETLLQKSAKTPVIESIFIAKQYFGSDE